MRCSPATKASSIASVAWYLASGPGAVSATPSSSASGYGWSQVISLRRVGSGGWNGGTGLAGMRRPAARSALRH
jgi:hypothetical protein